MNLLRIAEVAKSLRCSAPTVHNLVKSGQLPHVRFATNGKRGSVRVSEEDLVKFIEEHRSNGNGGGR